MDTSTFVPGKQELRAALEGADAAEAVLLAQQHLRFGDPRGAVALCEAAVEAGLAGAALSLCEATARFALGQHAQALSLTEGVLAAVPTHLAAMSLKAHMLTALGSPEGRKLLHAVVERYPDFPGALAALSTWSMPGLGYRDVLARLHRELSPRTYLEIGVETGATLALAGSGTRAVGVDPVAARLAAPLGPNARLFQLESDAFFARETKTSAFGGQDVDLTFIDGMHLFEYALRDFASAEAWASPAGTIVLHDCLSVAAPAARRERTSNFWVGDTWKALEALLDYRPELRVSVILTPPSGLVVVRGLVPASTVLRGSMDAIVARYRSLEYPYTPETWSTRLRLFRADENGIQQALKP